MKSTSIQQAITILTRYSQISRVPLRSTNDLSPLEEYLLSEAIRLQIENKELIDGIEKAQKIYHEYKKEPLRMPMTIATAMNSTIGAALLGHTIDKYNIELKTPSTPEIVGPHNGTDMKESEMFKNRLLKEYSELSEKLNRLKIFSKDPERLYSIDPEQRPILAIQEKAMETYLECLKIRLKLLEVI
jgi:hypothetical protein